jgi:hypothetical protein
LVGIAGNDTVLLSADLSEGILIISPTRLCDLVVSL